MAVLRTAAQLLREDGIKGLSIDEVSLRSKVSKATIYRWWSGKEEVALEAFLASFGDRGGFVADTGSLEADLMHAVRARVKILRSNAGLSRTLAGLTARAQEDSEFALLYRRMVVEPLRGAAKKLFERAKARGEIAEHADVEATLDMIYGALNHRVWQCGLPVTQAYAKTLVQTVMRGLPKA